MASSDGASPETPSENMAEVNYFHNILTTEEINAIPDIVASKITTHYNAKLEELFTSNALFEAGRREANEKAEKFEKEFADVSSKYEEYKSKFESCEETLRELESQFSANKEELAKTSELLKKTQYELDDIKSDRCSAVDERDSLSSMLERREREIERLKVDMTTLTSQLEKAINDKCEALLKANEIQNKEFTLNFKEQHMSQEKILLATQIKALNDQLTASNDELQTIRFTLSQKVLHLEAQLQDKSEELKMSQDSVNNLSEVNKTLRHKKEVLIQKLMDQHDLEENMVRNYKSEIETKTKLAELYKSMQEDAESKCNELSNGVTELQKLLSESVDKYGELETKYKQLESDHEEMLERKNTSIASMKKELVNANELLQGARGSSISQVLEKMSPLGGAAGRFLHANMTMTQLYTQLTDVAEELGQEKEENRRMTEALTNVYSELREKAPMFEELQTRYEEALEVNGNISRKLEIIMAENNGLTDEYNQAVRRSNHFQKENDKMKRELDDLGRQVCYLLREIEMTKGGSIPNGDKDADVQPDNLNSSELISRHLVTFSDIQELQTNNQKLLRTIRELTEKQEEKERKETELNAEEMQKKYDALETKIKEMVEERSKMVKMVENVVKQRDMYKKQCGNKKGDTSLDKSDITMELNKSQNKSSCEDTTSFNRSTDEESLKKQLGDTKSQLDKKIEEYRIYREEAQGNQKMLMQQIENMRKEMTEVTSAYSKAAAQLEFLNEKQNTLQLNITTYKKTISSLEQQNKSFSVTIGKSEQSMIHIRQEAANAQSRLAKCEGQIQNLLKEVQHLRNVETRLTTERDLLIKEKQGQGLLLNNLEMIKASLERAEGDSRVKLESRLDDANREIIAMRRTLQEEQTRFRELTSLLEKQTEEAKAKMEDEKNQADKLREELSLLHDKLKNNASNIDDICNKFPSTSSMFDSSVDLAKKVRELEGVLHSKQAELKYLQQELEVSKERVRQYCDISQEAEVQLQTLNTQYEELKTTSESQINTLQESENELKERCSELEAELSVQTDGQHVSSSELRTELTKTVEKVEALQNELNAKHAALQQAQAEALRLSVSTQQAEEKYAHEVVQHSNDIQALSQMKEKLSTLQQEFAELQNSKDQTLHNLKESQQAWEEQEKALNAEKEELLSRFADLNQQNSLLLDQIQALSTKLSLATVSKHSDNLNESANNSHIGDTSLNRSVNEDEVKSSEKLVQIIKFLRKERDIIVAKFDILQTENIRLKSQLDVTDKKLDETALSLALERQKSEENSKTSSKHSEILRKVEQLNAISDSNRVLREERESLIIKVNQLTEAISKLEETLAPLQETNQEMSCKLDSLQSENSSLKTEVGRWRTRVNALVGSVKETRFEDLRKLQNERESLSKVLSSEREVIKKLNEEGSSIKSEKIRLEEQIQALNRQHLAQTEQYKKHIEELNTLKKDFTRVTQELEQTKANLTEKSNDTSKLTESNTEKDATINDLRNKEAQIRKIAKKYKAQFEELTKTVEEDKNKREQEAAESAETSEGQVEANKELESKISDLEKSHSEKIAELEAKVNTAMEENNALKAENESLRVTTSEKEEKAKVVLKQAKAKIMQLTDSNENLTKQLNEVKGSIESAEQNKEENDTRFELLTSQYEARVNRAEKEKNEAIQEKQQEVQRLIKEIENLNQRVSQVQRQVGGPEAASATVAPTPTPTANIKPMAAHSAGTHSQQAARRGETPFASIRPMASTATRTAAVLPSPSSSGHGTEYMPASSSARMVMNQSISKTPAADSPPHPPQALVLPRVEEGPGSQPTSPSHSSDQAAPPRPSLKRKPQHSPKTSQQTKKSKVQQGQVTESHCETEYQVPTSSQRDHDDDGVILVDSEDEGDEEQDYPDNYQEGEEEEEEEDDDEDIEEEEEEMDEDEEDDGEGEGVGVGDEEDDDEAEDPEVGGEEEDEEDEEAEGMEAAEEEEEDAEDREEDADEQHQELPAQSECEVGESSEAAVSPQPPSAGAPPTSSTTTTSTTQHTDAQQSQQTHAVSSGTQE